jgi:hypothetical protein
MHCWQLAQSRTLIRAGLGLLLVSMIIGLLVPIFADMKRAVSTHIIGIAQGTLIALGTGWPRLALRKPLAIAAMLLLLYGATTAWLANLGAAIWRAGANSFPLSQSRGTPTQELLIAIGLRSAAAALLVATALTLTASLRRAPALEVERP